jgi:hypothetical protein
MAIMITVAMIPTAGCLVSFVVSAMGNFLSFAA